MHQDEYQTGLFQRLRERPSVLLLGKKIWCPQNGRLCGPHNMSESLKQFLIPGLDHTILYRPNLPRYQGVEPDRILTKSDRRRSFRTNENGLQESCNVECKQIFHSEE
jgi:hypothetical protein